MNFEFFVLPFSIGLVFLLGALLFTYINWIVKIEKGERQKISDSFFTHKTLSALKEVFMESLIHRKIFKRNPLLGYMHMSLAFGWFLLIVVGDIEVKFFNGGGFKAPYYPVFFRYFEPAPHHYFGSTVFPHIMDFLLLVVLSGVALALFKRIKSSIYGLRKTTKLRLGDRIALYSLWAVFPLRLLAESITSGLYNSGGFMTHNLGLALAGILPLQHLDVLVWWLYSIALGLFFITLPISRYMHIPTEVMLIFLRKYGLQTRKYYTSISEVEVFSCSRCGLCIDRCQLPDAQIVKPISVYFIRSVRNNSIDSKTLYNCMLCGRCTESCPVGIDVNALRIAKREEFNIKNKFTYDFEKPVVPAHSKVLYFAGCMGHLTPGVIKSMKHIFEAAGENYWFMDQDKGVCCGRPLMMAGQYNAALQLMNHNRAIINRSNAQLLVTSCPICYKVFKDKYNLKIKVMHHSEYINYLIENKRIDVRKMDVSAVYHDPCELGRGSEVYAEPRSVLNKIVTLKTSSQEQEKALCCGGSLGNFEIQNSQRTQIRDKALDVLMANKPDVLVTSCPLCKRTFAKGNHVEVKDIAELVKEAMVLQSTLNVKNIV